MDLILQTLVDNGEALAKLPGMGVTTYNWSAEDRATFRAAAQEQWNVYGGETPEGKAMVDIRSVAGSTTGSEGKNQKWGGNFSYRTPIRDQQANNHARKGSPVILWDFTYLCWDRPADLRRPLCSA